MRKTDSEDIVMKAFVFQWNNREFDNVCKWESGCHYSVRDAVNEWKK